MQGHITKWFPSQHYGFIKIYDGMHVFFHGADVTDPGERFGTGARVEFWLDDDRFGRGLAAVEIRRV
jgi:cold shock CspA family protein